MDEYELGYVIVEVGKSKPCKVVWQTVDLGKS